MKSWLALILGSIIAIVIGGLVLRHIEEEDNKNGKSPGSAEIPKTERKSGVANALPIRRRESLEVTTKLVTVSIRKLNAHSMKTNKKDGIGFTGRLILTPSPRGVFLRLSFRARIVSKGRLSEFGDGKQSVEVWRPPEGKRIIDIKVSNKDIRQSTRPYLLFQNGLTTLFEGTVINGNRPGYWQFPTPKGVLVDFVEFYTRLDGFAMRARFSFKAILEDVCE